MNATERLRSLLDERGIEWWSDSYDLGYDHTQWKTDDAAYTSLGRAEDGLLAIQVISAMTPEQAIAATLGTKTTTRDGKHRTRYGRIVSLCECCGYAIGDERYNHCPKCGARII